MLVLIIMNGVSLYNISNIYDQELTGDLWEKLNVLYLSNYITVIITIFKDSTTADHLHISITY